MSKVNFFLKSKYMTLKIKKEIEELVIFVSINLHTQLLRLSISGTLMKITDNKDDQSKYSKTEVHTYQ